MFYRHVGIRAEDMKPSDGGLKRLRILASTDAPCSMGGWREVLSHADGAIDTSSATALLLNHKTGWIAGALRSFAVDGKQMSVESDLDDTAKLESGMTASRAVEIGALRGASVGYDYERKDCSFDENTGTVTVNRWRLLELSLTPTPADAAAGIRSIPFDLNTTADSANNRKVPMRFSDWLKSRGLTVATITPDVAKALRSVWKSEHKDAKDSDDDVKDADLAKVDNSQRTDAETKTRAEQADIVKLVRSVGLEASDYAGLSMAEAKEKVLVAIQERAKTEHKTPAHAIQVTAEDCDKQVTAITEAYGERCGLGKAKDGNPYRGRGIAAIAQRYARSLGLKTEDWDRKDAAHFALGELSQVRGMRDAPNTTTGMFPNFVFLDAITKITAKGFEMAPKGLTSASGAPIYDTQMVPDFKSFNIGGLGMGELAQAAEGEAFAELAKTEGVYSDTAKMWGGTLSLTMQALINDDTGVFERCLRQAPALANKAMEKRLVQKFLRGIATTDASTWTSNTTSGCTPVWTTADTLAAARANLGKVNAALGAKLGLDGLPTGNTARFLFAGPTSGLHIAGLLGGAPGQTVANTGQAELVVSQFLEATAITGYSTTSYYGIADPMLATGLILAKIIGYENIQVQEYDAGAFAGRKWKLWIPFEGTQFWAANKAGTSIIPAAQQATT